MNNTPTFMQSEEKIAPWNHKTKTIKVNISQCLSTVAEIEVPEDLEDYDSVILEQYVREQIVLPSDTVIHCPEDWYTDELWCGI